MASTNPNFPSMKQEVKAALDKRRLERHVDVVDTVATVGAGYLELQGGSWGPLFPGIPHDMLAAKLADFYEGGENPHPPTKAAQRPVFRGAVEGVLASVQGAPASGPVPETLTSLALGAWDENAERALKAWIAGYIVSLYARGLD